MRRHLFRYKYAFLRNICNEWILLLFNKFRSLRLTGIFKKRLNTQNKLTRQLSASAYIVFIIHPLVLVTIGAVFKNLELYHFLKFLLLAPVAILSCFILAIVIRKIPLVDRVA